MSKIQSQYGAFVYVICVREYGIYIDTITTFDGLPPAPRYSWKITVLGTRKITGVFTSKQSFSTYFDALSDAADFVERELHVTETPVP